MKLKFTNIIYILLFKLFSRVLVSLLVSLSLAGCSTITGTGTDNAPAPAALVKYTSIFEPQRIGLFNTDLQIKDENTNYSPLLDPPLLFTAGTQGNIKAININTGKITWQMNLNKLLSTAIGQGNGLIIIGCQNGEVYALNQYTGKIIWHIILPDQISAPAVFSGNIIIIKTLNSQILALNSANGNIVWQIQHNSPAMILAGASAPKIIGNKVIAGFADGKLEAYTLDQGKLLWQVQLSEPAGASDVEQMVDITANLQSVDNIIYSVSYQGNLAAINANNGQIIWTRLLSSHTGLSLYGERIYITDNQGIVWAFNRHTGQIIFKQAALKYRELTAPMIANNYIITGDNQGYIHWLSISNGQTAARVKTDSVAIIALRTDNQQYIYAFNSEGRIFKYK